MNNISLLLLIVFFANGLNGYSLQNDYSSDHVLNIFEDYNELIIRLTLLEQKAINGNVRYRDVKEINTNWTKLNNTSRNFKNDPSVLLQKYYNEAVRIEDQFAKMKVIDTLKSTTLGFSQEKNAIEEQLKICFLRIISFTKIMDHYKNAWLIEDLLGKVEEALESNNKYLTEDIPDTIRHLQNHFSDELACLVNVIQDSIESKSDIIVNSISNLTNYQRIFVGPGLYIENTYAFSGLFKVSRIESFINADTISFFAKMHRKSFIVTDILYSSDGTKYEVGGALYYGIGLTPWSNKSKVIAFIGAQYLADLRSIDSRKNSNMHLSFAILFKNREWATGFSWSEVTGAGIRLMMGI